MGLMLQSLAATAETKSNAPKRVAIMHQGNDCCPQLAQINYATALQRPEEEKTLGNERRCTQITDQEEEKKNRRRWCIGKRYGH
jgi:hypothetical protein